MTCSTILKHFIVLEGIDGSGTTTQLKRMMKACEDNSIRAFETREPTNSPIGEVIDLALKHKISLSPKTITRLFATDRCEHIYGKGGIIEMLKEGLVLCDRYLFSSLAYQGATNEAKLTRSENSGFPLPQVLFFFDLPVEIAMKRIEKRSKNKELYEKTEFLKQVQKNYSTIMGEYRQNYPQMNIIHIDASLSEDAVFKKIKESMEEMGFFKYPICENHK